MFRALIHDVFVFIERLLPSGGELFRNMEELRYVCVCKRADFIAAFAFTFLIQVIVLLRMMFFLEWVLVLGHR